MDKIWNHKTPTIKMKKKKNRERERERERESMDNFSRGLPTSARANVKTEL